MKKNVGKSRKILNWNQGSILGILFRLTHTFYHYKILKEYMNEFIKHR